MGECRKAKKNMMLPNPHAELWRLQHRGSGEDDGVPIGSPGAGGRGTGQSSENGEGGPPAIVNGLSGDIIKSEEEEEEEEDETQVMRTVMEAEGQSEAASPVTMHTIKACFCPRRYL